MRTHVEYTREEDVGYLTFACEEAGKPATLDHAVLDELADQLDQIDAQLNQLRVVIVRSETAKYFVVGANVDALKELTPETIVPWVQKGHAVFNRLERLPLPVIARISGYCLGGGLELALACDLLVASKNAKLGQPEAALGLVSGWGGSYRLPARIGLGKAKELFFTGKIVTAAEAREMGLVDFAGEEAEVDDYLQSIIRGIRECSFLAVSQMKRLLNTSPGATIEENCYQEAVASSICLANEETKRRVSTYLESRKKR